MRRILSVWPDEEELDLLRDVERREVKLALRRPQGDVSKVKAAIFWHDEDAMVIARAEPSGTTGDLDYLFRFSEAVTVQGWTTDDVSSGMTTVQLKPFKSPGGVLGEAATRRALDALTDWPESQRALGRWLRESDTKTPWADSGWLPEQRDGTLLALKSARMDAGELMEEERWGVESVDGVFLPPAPREDPIIEHDLRVFLGAKRRRINGIGFAEFEDDQGRTLRVYNVNRTRVEGEVGADLVYVNLERRSAVLVQYKRMLKEGADWIYRPDEQYEKQADLFRQFERAVRRLPVLEPGSFRLSNSSCFFKYCRAHTYDVDDYNLVPGSYAANDYVDLYHQDESSNGPQGGRRVLADSFGSGLTNSLFADCVAYGLIGTPALTMTKLETLVRKATRASSATVLALYKDPVGHRPGPD